MNDRLNEITEKILPILREAGVTRAALFGSYVRGEQESASDLDVLVELPDDKSLLDLVDLKLKLEEALNREVDVLTFDAVHPRLRPHIEREQVPIL